jgi:deoxyribodipyrimidine photolyase-related protein
MELFIDAYDWVMVPNVYGMTQFADGGMMMTKPYISGSNYIFKMSDYKKESSPTGIPQWHEIWDGLFWRFMNDHRTFFLQNPRLGMLVNTFDKMDEEKKKILLNNAQSFLDKLDSELLQDEMKRS